MRSKVTSAPKEDIIKAVTALHKLVGDIVLASKGHIQCSVGDQFVITFNAASNVANIARRSVSAMFGIVHGVAKEFPGWRVNSGLCVGQAVVGGLGGAFPCQAVFSPMISQASVLAGLCAQYGPTVPCLAHMGMKEELVTSAYVQYLDIVNLPGRHNPRSLIMGVMHLMAVGADNEWMNELEQAAGKNPYALVNGAFASFMMQDLTTCSEFLEQRDFTASDVMKEHLPSVPMSVGGEGGATPQDGAQPDAVGYSQIVRILAAIEETGQQPSDYVSPQGKYFDTVLECKSKSKQPYVPS